MVLNNMNILLINGSAKYFKTESVIPLHLSNKHKPFSNKRRLRHRKQFWARQTRFANVAGILVGHFSRHSLHVTNPPQATTQFLVPIM